MDDALAAIVDTARRITDSYPRALCQEAVDRRRLDKIGSEFGELMEAFGGVVGENPRKGVTHAMADVLDEVLDVALTALGAYEHLTGFQGRCLGALAEQAVRKHKRLVDAMDGNGPPAGQPGLIGRDDVLVHQFAEVLHRAAVREADHTDLRTMHRGRWFEARVADTHVVRVSVVLDRVEPTDG